MKWSEAVLTRLNAVNDLPAADAIYHQTCSVNFRTKKNIPTVFDSDSISSQKKGRPYSDEAESAFLLIVNHLEENDNEQITLNDLVMKMQEVCGDKAYSPIHLKKRLKEHFCDSLLFTDLCGKVDVVTLKRTGLSILHDFYKQQENEGSEAKKRSIIEAAGKLIRSDIKSIATSHNEYPSPADISSCEKNIEYLPDSLMLLLQTIVSGTKSTKKIASLGQAIIQATRPNVLIAPLQLALGVQLHHQFASRFLIDTLNSLGFCASYTEIQKFESSAAVSQGTDIPGFVPGTLMQYVADNVYHNSRTIDGHDTFHGMGIIVCVTPATASTAPIQRKQVTKEEICNAAEVQISYYNTNDKVKEVIQFDELQKLKALDRTWKLDLLLKITTSLRVTRPGWSGQMQLLQKGDHPGKVSVIFMPMIDMDPGDLNCIYTTLKFVNDHAERHYVSPIITFDQPLYWKAFNIILSEPKDSPLRKIVLRLGGFHTIMSFLGSIGHLMQGSGFSEVLETVYAPNAVLHMISGKAVARSIRGHFLVENALMSLLVEETFDMSIAGLCVNESVFRRPGCPATTGRHNC